MHMPFRAGEKRFLICALTIFFVPDVHRVGSKLDRSRVQGTVSNDLDVYVSTWDVLFFFSFRRGRISVAVSIFGNGIESFLVLKLWPSCCGT